MEWRLIQSGKGSCAWNMALDEALLRSVQRPVLRLYEWDRDAVSIGYFQSKSVVPVERSFVRRYTGGGLVDHRNDVTYTVVLPRGNAVLELSTTESYRQIHEAVVMTLRSIEIEAELATCCDPREHDACFQRAVKFDVVFRGEKLAGAAQRRTREGMLQQGSVFILEERNRILFREQFPGIFSTIFKSSMELSSLTEIEFMKAKELEQCRYSQEEWNQMK